MPADAFKTRKGEGPVEIGGLPLIDDTNGVPVEDAALVMRELQDDDGNPLTGRELLDAAKAYAERAGLQVGKSKASPDDAQQGAGGGDNDAPGSAPETKE